ncbi:hypothetical protein EAH85_09460 [Curtobacterium flaccumfaciens]|nr:hypothetical protein EAH85_09460 [Curtobacterium flaccumfaciens]
MAGWQVGRLAGWQVGRLAGWQIGRWADRQAGRLHRSERGPAEGCAAGLARDVQSSRSTEETVERAGACGLRPDMQQFENAL